MLNVTYICPCLNNLYGLKVTVNSFLSVRSPNIFLHIVDGLSSDGTLDYLNKIVKQYPRISFFSCKDSSLYEALNSAIVNIPSGYIGIIGSGDSFIPLGLVQIQNYIRDLSPTLPLPVISAAVYRYTSESFRLLVLPQETSRLSTALNMNFCHPALLLHKSHYEVLGAYNSAYRIVADHHFVIRLVSSPLRSLIVYLPYVLVSMKYGGLSQRLSTKPILFAETLSMYIEFFPWCWPVLSVCFLLINSASLLRIFCLGAFQK